MFIVETVTPGRPDAPRQAKMFKDAERAEDYYTACCAEWSATDLTVIFDHKLVIFTEIKAAHFHLG